MPAPDDEISRLLLAIQHGDDTNVLADNRILSEQLGASLVDVAAILEVAKERSLIWGQRSGAKPGPWFNELELTVQGRRFLDSHRAPARVSKAASGRAAAKPRSSPAGKASGS